MAENNIEQIYPEEVILKLENIKYTIRHGGKLFKTIKQ